MKYVLFQIANKNHSKNARHAAALYIHDIKAFVRYILILTNKMMLSGRKPVTNSLPGDRQVPLYKTKNPADH
jgi:hypothetical protein